jgi:hypothetical protein
VCYYIRSVYNYLGIFSQPKVTIVYFLKMRISSLRLNLPAIPKAKRRFPLRLKTLLTQMFPQSKLAGRNHQSLHDVQQARLICMVLINLCRSPEKRSMIWDPKKLEDPENHHVLE